MKYRKLLALLTVIGAVALSAPGCGKKNDPAKPNYGVGVWGANNFQVVNGSGQASLLSYSSCYRVNQSSDGSISFPIATSGSAPHTLNGYLNATVYVALQFIVQGNRYTMTNSYGDTMEVYINGQFLSGRATLSSNTVGQIKAALRNQYNRGSDSNSTSLCIDGFTITNAYLNNSTILSSQGQYSTVLYVDNLPFPLF